MSPYGRCILDTMGNHLKPACKAMEVAMIFAVSLTRPVVFVTTLTKKIYTQLCEIMP